jgi:ribose 5-phosphate isomerase A
MVVGLGTGSTVFYTIQKLGQLVKEDLSIKGIPTSVQTEELAKELGIPLTSYSEIESILNMIPGVVENGLFVGMTDLVITLDLEKNVVVLRK